eukprot:357386-Chlamydomonas_euryale.AAC.5
MAGASATTSMGPHNASYFDLMQLVRNAHNKAADLEGASRAVHTQPCMHVGICPCVRACISVVARGSGPNLVTHAWMCPDQHKLQQWSGPAAVLAAQSDIAVHHSKQDMGQ